MQTRDAYFDLIKGLAITGVITIHFVGFNSADHMVSLFRQLACCAVPVFFFLAGYFVRVKSDSSISWIGKRLLRLMIPYLLITGTAVVYSHPDHFTNINKWLIHDIILGEGIGIGYFVIALSQLIFLTSILVCALKKNAVLTLSICLVLNMLAIGYFYLLCFGLAPKFGCSVPVPIPGVFFPTWIFFYAFGVYLSDTSINVEWKVLSFALICSVGFMYAEKWFIPCDLIGISQLRLSAFVYSVCVCALIVISRRQVQGAWGVLGRGSFFVYLVHMRIFKFVFGIFNYFGWSGQMRIGWYFLGLVSMVLVFCGIIIVSEYMVPVRIRRWVGLS